jgi:hypothetical protein
MESSVGIHLVSELAFSHPAAIGQGAWDAKLEEVVAGACMILEWGGNFCIQLVGCATYTSNLEQIKCSKALNNAFNRPVFTIAKVVRYLDISYLSQDY